MEKNITGTVLEIQRMSTEDGPGIRTTVFLKGCSLNCAWCHNPESISPKPQVHWIESRCIGCGLCVESCPSGALSMHNQGIAVDRGSCTGCGTCSAQCPATAMELLGRRWSVDELIKEVVKDTAYFDKSGGGITLSGGEPTVQPDFSIAFLKGITEHRINTALDTCGFCPWQSLEQILPYTDHVLYDIKEIDPEKHKAYTHASNERILDNLMRLSAYMQGHDRPSKLWRRTPIIPGATDRDENISGIGAFIAQNLADVVSRWELCAFNNLCIDKYRRLGRTWDFADASLMTRYRMEEMAEAARLSGVDPGIVLWSGTVQLEDPRDGPAVKGSVKDTGIMN